MISKKLFLIIGLFVFSYNAHAQFGLPSILGAIAGGGAGQSNAAEDVISSAEETLMKFIDSEVKIAEALGVYNLSQEHQDLLARRAKGDVAARKEIISSSITISNGLNESLKKGIEAKKTLDVSQKKLAAEGTLNYVEASLSALAMTQAIQAIVSDPASLLTAGVESNLRLVAITATLPKMIAQSISSSSTIIKYMAANGVDVSKAKKSAEKLCK